MVVSQNNRNETNKKNPSVDTGLTTVNAYNVLAKKRDEQENYHMALEPNKSEKEYVHRWKYSHKNMNRKIHIKAWTQDDNQYHNYFHSLNIDVQVQDFMGTAELRCPYDSSLMEYWEPIRQSVVIYGDNGGQYKDKNDILFVGRVRELQQDGYELSITFQNYGWKFKQNVSTSYANDNVLNKNGYAIMCAMFEALKIDSYVISPTAEKRLREVGIDSDGNLKANGEKIEEIPDLIERLKQTDLSEVDSEKAVSAHLKEDTLANIKDINYTLKYEEPTEAMKNITGGDSGSFTPSGAGIYPTQWSGGGGGGAVGAVSGVGNALGGGSTKNCNPPNKPCASIGEEYLQATARELWKYQRGCGNNYHTYIKRWDAVKRKDPKKYNKQIVPCIQTVSKVNTRGNDAKWMSERHSGVAYTANKAFNSFTKALSGGIKAVGKAIGKAVTGGFNRLDCWGCKLKYGGKYKGKGDRHCNKFRYQNGKGYFKC